MSLSLDELIQRLWITEPMSSWRPRTTVIALDEMRIWMKCDDLELMGFLSTILMDGRFRLEPAIALEEHNRFLIRYYDRCIRENPEGEWSDGRYSAGWDAVSWFIRLWDDPRVPRSLLQEIKEWLAALLKSSDQVVREAVVNAILEHLFERKQIARFFEDWKQDPDLRSEYESGLLWAKDGGHSPLTEKPG